MRLNKFKILCFLITISFLFSVTNFFVSAQERGLETQYPIIDGQEITTSTTIAEYAVYIFKFSMILATIIAFAVLIYGGFRYVASAGNPTAMTDAKAWILSGIIGLALILFSYLLLMMINPGFEEPKVEKIDTVGGILLTDENDILRPAKDDIYGLSEDFNAVSIQFLTSKPKSQFLADINKAELIAIFCFSEKDFKGEMKTIKNNKSPESEGPSAKQGLPFSPRSIIFFWQEPGVYLYQEANFGYEETIPKICKSGTKNLKEFSNKTKSIALVNKGEDGEIILEEYYTAVVFGDTNYQGVCDLVVGPYNVVSRLQSQISSIAIAKGTEIYGEVMFCDKENCEMEEDKEPFIYSPGTLGDKRYGVVKLKETYGLKQWLSLAINGNLSVLMNSEEDLKGRCAVFDKIGCTSDFKGTWVYSSDPNSFRPKEAYIFSSFK